MDNIFGKDDSGNDSDHVDVDCKEEQSDSFESKQSQDKDSIDRLDLDISSSDLQGETDAVSVNLNLEQDKTAGLSPEMPLVQDELMDIVKHEIEIDGREDEEINNTDRLFDNVIVPSHINPMTVKDRRESKEKSKRELEEEEREKMQVLVSNFTEDQLDRYEMYRRAAFPKAAIKRIMQTITGCSVSQNVVIAMSGIAKVFVGEIVEEALDVMETNNETGPLQPKHLREAVRRLRLQGQIPNGRAHKAFFRL